MHPRNSYLRYDQKTERQLDGLDIRLLELLRFLCGCQAKKSPIGARYCCPSELYLAGKLDVCRKTISLHVVKLRKLGVLSVTHRRQIRGVWQTNLYKIISSCWWRLGQVLQQFRKQSHRAQSLEHKAYPMREILNSETPASRPSGSFTPLKEAIAQYAPHLLLPKPAAG